MSPHRHENPAEHIDTYPADGLFGCLLISLAGWGLLIAVGILVVQAVREAVRVIGGLL